MDKLNGYDIDGVLTKGIRPIHPYIIISGRDYTRWEETINQIGFDAPIYLNPNSSPKMPGNRERSGEWKAEMINRLGVTDFWEDDPVQAKVIAAKTKCNLIMVK